VLTAVVTFGWGDSDNASRYEWFQGPGDTMDTGSVPVCQHLAVNREDETGYQDTPSVAFRQRAVRAGIGERREVRVFEVRVLCQCIGGGRWDDLQAGLDGRFGGIPLWSDQPWLHLTGRCRRSPAGWMVEDKPVKPSYLYLVSGYFPFRFLTCAPIQEWKAAIKDK